MIPLTTAATIVVVLANSKGKPVTNLTIVCADVGSVKKARFGWWSSQGAVGTAPSTLAIHVASLLNHGTRVALGFECPLFVPLAEDEALLTSQRPGENGRPWSAGAGCGALATGLVEVAWVLQAIWRQLVNDVPAFVDWPAFADARAGLFLWEAFVTGTGKQSSHVGDARAAGEAFQRALPDPMRANAIECTGAVYSLLGAALLRTGWSKDLDILERPCLVVSATTKTH